MRLWKVARSWVSRDSSELTNNPVTARLRGWITTDNIGSRKRRSTNFWRSRNSGRQKCQRMSNITEEKHTRFLRSLADENECDYMMRRKIGGALQILVKTLFVCLRR